MRLNSNVYDNDIYTLNYYEDKYFISLFAHLKHTVKIYGHNFTHLLKTKWVFLNKQSPNQLYIHIFK